jgi:hypothetical protein
LGVLCLGSMRDGLIEAGMGAALRAAAFVLLAPPLGTLLVWRARRARHPRVPLRLFRDRHFVVANAMTVVLYAALTGSLFLLPFVLMDTYGYSAAAAGSTFLPLSAIMAAGNLATASGYAAFALSAARPEDWPGSRLAWCRPESAWSRVWRRLRQWSWRPLHATWVVPRVGDNAVSSRLSRRISA